VILQQNKIGGTVSEAVKVPGESDNSDQTIVPEHVVPLGKLLIFKFSLAIFK